jgi:transcription-repair coupling factor (superfamily II helicase)
VSGIHSSAKALLIVRYNQLLKKNSFNQSPIVLICPQDEMASELLLDIECIARIVDQNPIRVVQLPTWEQSPYSSVALSLKTRHLRIAALNSLLQDSPPEVLVTSIPALSQATLPKEFFRQYSLQIGIDQNIGSRDLLIQRLLAYGYLRVDPVEDPGTFAVRGDILDLFPIGETYPYRIELFDDVVERIRAFDPSTQRATSKDSSQSVKNLILPPAREVLINSNTVSLLRERLKAYADSRDIPRSIRDPVLSSIRDGSYTDHSDAWASFVYSDPESAWNYLPPDSAVIWNDELSCQQEWDQFRNEQTQRSQEAPQSGVLNPAVGSIFRWNSELENQVKKQSTLYLDRIDLVDLSAMPAHPEPEAPSQNESAEPKISSKHRVVMKGNGDLEKGSRHSLGELDPQFKKWLKNEYKIIVLASTASQLERIRFLLEEHQHPCSIEAPPQTHLISLQIGSLSEGFRWPTERLVLLTDGEILGARHSRQGRQKASASKSSSAARDWSGLQTLSDLSSGDAIVHLDHGIGRYQGLVRLSLSGAPSDFLMIEYANKDKLYLPIYRLNVIQKYVGAGESVVLDRLGSSQFAKTKDKVKEDIKKLAIDLVQLYAERKIRPGMRFAPRDAEFCEFEAQFPFDETPDQLKSIDAILDDMESGRVMDRLVCGDVGYGKTEVAIRAAFRAVSDGKQVAVLVPTTILAQQHEQSFKNRLKDYPLIIESVSRFKNAKTQRQILEAVAQGKVDIVVGTHRLLSRDVKFKDLGLIVVDEEHRFGVEHKERLKTIKVNTHVLTLTATPIPRTLHMALSGIRDISLINTPPVDRLPVRTFVSKFDEALLQRAIEFELARGGQVFFLHNRVQSIHEITEKIRKLVPHSQVIVAHGQMPEAELEDAMLAFYQKKANVLVCTTIIESGLDIPSANTMIINRADSFGLAQLYQIRGRVGRGQQRAYAYLFIPAEGAITDDAKRRLEVIQRFVELGSGFHIASHDLEIRGGGDLLGPQQSGNIAAVGFDLYTELLEEAIQEIQGKPIAPEDSLREPEIKIPFPAFLSEQYVPDVHQRLSLYRRFSAANQDQDVDKLEEELLDRFGDLPSEAQNLLWLIRIKILLKRMGIDALTVGPEKVSLTPGPQSQFDPVRIIALVSAYPQLYQLMPDSRLIAKVSTQSLRDLFFGMEKLFKDFMTPS